MIHAWLVGASLLLRIHQSWAWVVVVGNGLAGAWALGAHWLPRWRHRALWWFTAAVEVAIVVQVGLGVGLIAGEKLHVPRFHQFYGYITLVSVAIIYAYRTQLWRYRYLLYGLGGWFLMGLAIRAMVVAHAGHA